NDIVARMVATQLGERLGQQVVIDNRGGAGGVLGTDLAAKSPADGYTLLLISVAYAFGPALYRNLPYDPERAFAPVGILGSGAAALTVHPSLPVSTVRELIAHRADRQRRMRSEEHTSELQSRRDLVCRLLL